MLKKLSRIFIVVLIVIASTSSLEGAEQIKLGVLSFSSPQELLQEADEVTRTFTQALSASPAITILNRSRIDTVPDEEADINAVSALGRKESCKYILLGSLKRDKDIVISIRAVDIETATITFTMSAAGSSSKSLRAESMKLGERVRERLTGEFPRVLSVKGSDIYVNRGRASGLRKGDLLRVYREGRSTMDVEGNLSGRVTVDLALIEVKSVKEEECAANLVKGGGDAATVAELNNFKVEAISQTEARKLISQKLFETSAVKKRIAEAGTQPDVARELNPDMPVDKEYIDNLQNLAKKGHPKAQTRLGSYYLKRRDFRTALKWFREAASEGNADAYSELGYIYSHALGVPQNYNKAFDYFLKAAKLDVHAAKINLGMMYQLGTGVKQDHKEAFLWYAKAWMQDEDIKTKAAGANNMAYMYYNGLGVKRSIKLAMPLYREAANNGNLQAKMNLGMIYFNGSQANILQSVKKGSQKYDLIQQSQKWFQAALDQATKEHNNDVIQHAQRQLEILSRIAVQ